MSGLYRTFVRPRFSGPWWLAAGLLAAGLALVPHGAAAQGVATAVATARDHACAITAAGGAKCWGSNSFQQLGNGETTGANRPSPVDVVGLASGVAKLAAGDYHTCALTTAGGVKCWGYNSDGQIGDGSATGGFGHATPVDVSGLASGVTAIAANYHYSCALTSGGGVKCWGAIPGGLSSLAPMDVPGLTSGVAAISAGVSHACAVTTAGGLKCWGYNGSGQLGDGTTIDRATPVNVVGLTSGVAAVAAANAHTCALTTGGAVKCWGYNFYGLLGDGTSNDSSTPVNVVGLSSGVASIATGTEQSCARMASGGVKCWGHNDRGEVGDGTFAVTRYSPVDVQGLPSAATAVAAGQYYTCAVVGGGGLKCWGDNYNGTLGIGSNGAYRAAPFDVVGLASGVAAVSAGDSHTCAITTAGGAKCWGRNKSGQVGDGTAGGNRLLPVDVSGLASGVASVASGDSHTCAVSTSGASKCWGSNFYGAIGDGTNTDRSVPTGTFGLSSGIAKVVAGGGFACALTAAGGVKCWGVSAIGNGSFSARNTPADVSGLTSGVTAIGAGGSHACAVVAGGTVKCWGFNTYGQLGNGTATNSSTPVAVVGLPSGVTSVVGGYNHTCALTSAGGVSCWGDNFSGELGDGTTVARASAAPVSGLSSGVAAITAGTGFTCALTTVGGVKCWGANSNFQLGDGTFLNRLAPVDVVGLTSGVVAIEAGASHTCAVTVSGGLKCWGVNGDGQIGDGTAQYSTTPMDVVGFAPPAPFAASPGSVDFGGQSINTTSPSQTITLTNNGASTATISAVTISANFSKATACASLAPGASCTITVTFTPTASGALTGSLVVQSSAGTASITLAGTGERSLVTHYYRSILRRAPDAGGKAFWEGEAARVQVLGVNVNETWFAMAQAFYGSAEYAALNRDNTGYVTDLYTTFFNRAPDAGGLTTWTGLLAAGMPREVVLASFMFSSEFATFTQAIFGTATTRKEVDTVTDFYRGLLGRLPDDAGFQSWLQLFRTAQCQGAAAVAAEAESMSSLFALSGEYGARGRNDSQYVGDLYNAFLRRGGDLAGVQFWIGQVTTGAMTREAVRRQFVASPEFSARVNAIVQQGCLP